MGLWKDLLKRRQVETSETERPRTSEETEISSSQTSSSSEPEQVLYFQDRLRSRRNDESAAAQSHASAENTASRLEESELAESKVAPAQVQPQHPSAIVREPDFMENRLIEQPFASSPAHEDLSWREPEPMQSEAVEMATCQQERMVLESGTEAHGFADVEEQLAWVTPLAASAAALPEASAQEEALAREVACEAEPPEPGVERVERTETLTHDPFYEVEPAEERMTSTEEITASHSRADVSLGKHEESPSIGAEQMVRPKREPTPPKMEWFTLRFRGTSERVLRIVPGEEGSAEPEGTPSAEEEDSMGTAALPQDEERAETEVDPEQTLEIVDADGMETESGEPLPEPDHEEESEQQRPAEHLAVAAFTAEEREVETVTPEFIPRAADEKPVPDSPEGAAPVSAAATDEEVSREPEVEASPVPSLSEEDLQAVNVSPIAAATEPAVEAPAARAKINRWTVSDQVPGRVGATPSADGSMAADELSPARLVEQLRSRTGVAEVTSTAPPAARAWGRRSMAAPVEERLESKAPSMTRRWQMLSRFDLASDSEVPAEPRQAVSTAADETGE